MNDTATEISPFVPGARVAIVSGYNWDHWVEEFVDKVHKTGRFVLRGRAGQWTARKSYNDDYWRAHESGRHSYRQYARIWDEQADNEFRELNAKQERRRRQRKLSDRLAALHEIELTDAMLDQIEAALPALVPSK